MTSETPPLEQTLQAGLAAIRRRDLSLGRALLLQVVEKDDQQELAWLWLSVAVGDPVDKKIALENVLTINPANPVAQKRLARLTRRSPNTAPALTPPPTPAPTVPTPDDYLAGAPADVDTQLDDPFQCAYCGQITAEADTACPKCGRSLYVRAPKSEMSDFLKTALIFIGVTATLGALEVAAPFAALIASQTADKSMFNFLLAVAGVQVILGNFLQPAYTAAAAQNLIVAFLARSGLLVSMLLGLSQRWRPVYYAALGLLVVDIAWNVYLLVMGYLGGLSCLLNGALTIFSLTLLAASDREFAVVLERLWTQPDAKARSAADFYMRGRTYRRAGQWALAVAQWRRAVGLAPRKVAYHKDLGIGYAQIGRFDRSLRVLAEAQRQAPTDAQIPTIIEAVRAQAAASVDRPKT